MNCPRCGVEVTVEQCDMFTGICNDCTDTILARTRKKSHPVVTWAGRISHVLLSALVCAPFGVLGLGLVAAVGLLTLGPVVWVPAVLINLCVDPIGTLVGLLTPGMPISGDFGPEYSAWIRSDWWKMLSAFLLAVGVLTFCYYLDRWKGVLIGGAALGALIGAILSILTQLPRKARATRSAP
jgi:hypothetical protein